MVKTFLVLVICILTLRSLRTEAKDAPRGNCSCEMPSLCEPLSAVPEKEVLGFVVDKVEGNTRHTSIILITVLFRASAFSLHLGIRLFFLLHFSSSLLHLLRHLCIVLV